MPPGNGAADLPWFPCRLSSGCQPPPLERPGSYDFQFVDLLAHVFREGRKRRCHAHNPDGGIIEYRAAGRLENRHLLDCAILDRKSTRLNSSHVRISYAVFCLKKKTINT